MCDDTGGNDDGNSCQFFVPNKHLALSAIYALCHLTFPTLQFRHYSHFTDEGKEAQGDRGTCPRSCKSVAEVGVKILPVAKGYALLLTTGH